MNISDLNPKDLKAQIIALYKRTLGSVIVMEWSFAQKSMLLLVFMIMLYSSYVLYMFAVPLNPEWAAYINVPLFKILIWKDILVTLLAAIFFCCCYIWRKSAWANRHLPLFIIVFYAISMCLTGYLVGAMSPATGIFLIGTPLIGLALFPRGMVLWVTILATILMTSLAFAGVSGWIAYAPLFASGGILDLKQHSRFYFYSQMYFMLPPSLIILVAADVILKQWHMRGREVTLLSQLDSLTNLFNRRTINEHLERLIIESTEAERISILILDLDHFKQINDTHGHMIGDEVLKAVGQVLQQSMRKNDVAGRFGGEEFIVVLARSERQVGMQVAERIRNRIQAIRILDKNGQEIKITTSVGVSSCAPQVMTGIDPMLHEADQALYFAKNAGRNQVIHFDQLVVEQAPDFHIYDAKAEVSEEGALVKHMGAYPIPPSI
ncbi:GGDEF domain-containing protein [Aquirhabdus parva]|uniref:diguanylate cyclase n=1 Tax=Aquirhabdus parva TaxID=2283318 RepID=A0A345P8B6_9GAMM|nr:GGDEF domain-containing protein [Aquirhabdus parva]AXI03525.1 GGDEF domain-containing protein [Aquirhabdus parva]